MDSLKKNTNDMVGAIALILIIALAWYLLNWLDNN
nr:MAG TPA: Protein of unknown function (DUF4245) [Crassvirales sp.]